MIHVPSPHQGTEDLQLRWQVVQESAELHAIKLASASTASLGPRAGLKNQLRPYPQQLESFCVFAM